MIYVNSICVSPQSITLRKGSWYHDASVQVSPSNATCKQVTWRSTNPSVAGVNQSSGQISANAGCLPGGAGDTYG